MSTRQAPTPASKAVTITHLQNSIQAKVQAAMSTPKTPSQGHLSRTR